MDFEWTMQKKFQDAAEKHYINDCCIGGDEILELFKADSLIRIKKYIAVKTLRAAFPALQHAL